MGKAVSAAEANRSFSKLLRAVRDGQSYVVTSHGKAVARIIPVAKDDGATVGGKNALLKRLRAETVVKVAPWIRDEVYDGES